MLTDKELDEIRQRLEDFFEQVKMTPSELGELVKAREEKQEGCEYCKQIITTVKMDFETDSILGENKWFSSTRRPNFCPMCGRKFRTEGDAL